MMRIAMMLRCSIFSTVVFLALPAPAAAQGFVSPFVGVFTGDENCASLSDCDTNRSSVGVSAGALGRIAGFEAEFSFAKNFLGEAPGFESDMLTLMGNLLIAPKFAAVRPYGVVGFGLMRSTASLTAANVLVSENNDFGWDVGGGLMIFFGDHVGIRFDLRRFQSLQDVSVFGFTLSDSKIAFARVSGALIFAF
jgi:hypothetical protein